MLTMNTTPELNWWYHEYVRFLPDIDREETETEIAERHQEILDKLTRNGMSPFIRYLLDDYIQQISGVEI